ncbi:alpha/beta hydrolase [Pantanalinema sp. GBBB05]|uniref:alpha/beta hydrolase n=1 Tax=Pantanalinema sp. GBBB05 TaxID=2604139 RepID=UPI001D6ABBBF|nr:alpha/beta fold hydrolase [Pantanalinema sp. GBBB05]
MPKPSKRLIKITVGISLFLGTGYLGISAFAAHVLSTPQKIFDRNQKAIFSQSPQDVRFSSADGIPIAAWFLPVKGSAQAVILVHGMHSSRTAELDGHFAELGAALQQQKLAVLMIDLRGHGQSGDARFTFGLAERQDVIAAVNWLKHQGFQAGKIGVLGVSMGAATAIGATADDADIGAVVADSGYAEVYPVMQRNWAKTSGLPDIFLPTTMMFGSWYTGYDLTSSKPVNEVKRIFPRSILIIHSVADPFTPVEQAQQLTHAAPSAEYWQTTAPTHAGSYAINPQAYMRRVTTFFHRHLQ